MEYRRRRRSEWPLALCLLAAVSGWGVVAWLLLQPREPPQDERRLVPEKSAVERSAFIPELPSLPEPSPGPPTIFDILEDNRASQAPRPVAGSARLQSEIDFQELYEKGRIIGGEGAFLGLIKSDTYDRRSIANQYGPHGSRYSSDSIFNECGRFGSQYSSLSPWNDLAQNPPLVYVDEQFVGYLTTNRFKSPRIDPYALVGHMKAKR